MKEIIKEFLEATPAWLEAIKIPSRIAWKNGNCLLCGMSPEKIEKLYEALKEDYGEIKIKIIK
jgi:hypothetical protein